jgi:alkylhydroperoxidase family enzyme
MKVVRENQRRSKEWYGLLEEKQNSGDERAELLYSNQSPVANESIDLPPDQLLWTPFWDVATQYHDMVSGPTATSLTDVAAKYPRESRYAIDLGSGASVSLPHLAALRTLARAQNFEVWMAAMEDRPADALQTIKAMGPLAESLREEPILISQLVRIALHGIMTSAVEQALNRTEFTDAQLVEIQDYLSTVLPPLSEHSMIAQGLIGERVFSSQLPIGDFVMENGINVGILTRHQSLLFFSRMVLVRCFAEMEKNSQNASTPFLQEIEESTNPQFVLPKILLPGLDRSREAEFRCRVMHAIAATACAVERYRLANGALPATLDALVPTFLDAIPVDPFRDDQGPVSYRIREDGGYALYTWAQNRKDDGGIPRDPKKKEGSDWNNGDWIFSVAPLSFRNGPQFTDVPPVDEEK